jgi:hypothetical protein
MQSLPCRRSSSVTCRITRTVRVLDNDGCWRIERSCGETVEGVGDADFFKFSRVCLKCQPTKRETAGVISS